MESAGKTKLSFGFRPARPSSSSVLPPVSRSGVGFDDDDDLEQGRGLGSAEASSSKRLDMAGPSAGRYAAPASRADKRKQKEAEQLDASVFDYDGVYDTIKEAERKVRALRTAETAGKKPKYIEGILDSAEQRKRDRLRAEARTIQKQREAEGEEYADTEAFVTNAYKEQQAELSKAEEREDEAEALQRKKNKGLSGFYRDMIEQSSAVREAAIAASLTSQSDTKASGSNLLPERTAGDKAKEARERGLTVELNDDNEIVDNRQLLSKGLNIVSKSRGHSRFSGDREETDTPNDKNEQERQRREEYEARMNRDSQRARQSAQIQKQMLEQERIRHEEEEQDRLKQLEQATAKRNDASAISDAKQRYLERKRKKAEEQFT